MKNKRLLKMVLCLILSISFFSINLPITTKASTSIIGTVALKSGTLNVRKGPSTKYNIVGSLKNGTKVTIYNQTKSGWAEIRYKKKKGYTSTQYLRFYCKMSESEAKVITDKVITLQRKTWKKNYTKKQIYSIMSPGYTTSYIEQYFKQQMRSAGKDRNGVVVYHVIETEIWGLAIDSFDWKLTYQPKKPAISYSKISGKEYLVVSQYFLNDESGNLQANYSYLEGMPKQTGKYMLIQENNCY